jgi:hypothetical protein
MITAAETAHLSHRPTASIFLEGKLPVVAATVARDLGLRNDQVVNARAQAHGAGWALQLPGYMLQLPGDLPPSLRAAPGEPLQFRVVVQADGSVLLRPLPAAPNPAAAAPLLPERSLQLLARPPDANALRQLFTPATLDQLLQTVRQLAPELATSLQVWMQQRPAMAQLTPARLQQLLMQGGWMTEALLAQGRGAGMIDLKSQLRGLLRALGNSHSEVRGLLEDALDDIESRQLQASESAQGGKEMAISMVLPFVDAYPVEVKLSWQRPQADQPSRFMIQLHTDSPTLGDVWLQSQITDLHRVDLVMWADRADVAQKAQARSASLADELDSAGLQMGQLQIIHGRRPDSTEAPWRPPHSGSVVDVAT